ncbi:MAG: patatin-like phospholipase family protein [Thermoanaerobacteraceae bacterium]|nr:patatin-like phospholipase family protein [Thermoanaerobacteraceae bacterium]
MYGLVLEGGGGRGAYQIGAFKALVEMGIEVKGVAGTSVGALNGAMIVQEDFEKAYDLWYDMSYSRVINADDEKIEKFKKGNLNKEDIFLLKEKLKGIIEDKGLDITPLKNLLKEIIDEGKIRNSGKDFGIVTVSLTDLKPLELYIENIPKGKLVDYLMASAYLPIFKREKIDGKRYVDGGIYNNLPANLLINKGYKNLILIRTHGFGVVRKMNLKGFNIITISSKEELSGILDFDKDVARYNLKLGYFDGLKAFKGLKGKKYYIEVEKNKEYFFDYLINLDERKVLKINKIFGINKSIPYRRALFEFVIPKLSGILDLSNDADYEDIILALIDKTAEICQLERFRVYSYEEIVNKIKETIGLKRDKQSGLVDKIIKKVDVLSIFNKDDAIKEIARIIL